jgi:hypothetical protein
MFRKNVAAEVQNNKKGDLTGRKQGFSRPHFGNECKFEQLSFTTVY